MKAQVKVPSFAAPRLGALRWLLVGATCLSAAAAQAQSPPPRVASKAYTNKPIFRLPFTLSPADRQRAQAVALYACCGDEPLVLKETTSPAHSGFKYVATKDGEYGFEIAVLDKNGRPAREQDNRFQADRFLGIQFRALAVLANLRHGACAGAKRLLPFA